MTVIQNTYTGDGSTVLFSFTFEYLNDTEVRVSVNGVNTTEFTLVNATTVQMNTAPANGALVRIYRVTDIEEPIVTYNAGSAIRARDLNDNESQLLNAVQELDAYSVFADGSKPLAGDLDANGYQISNLGAPNVDSNAATKGYVDTNDALKVAKAGDTMSGNLAMSGNRVTGLGTPSIDSDAATKQYVDNRFGNLDVPGYTRWRTTATEGQTVFSGAGEYGGTLAYSATRENVYINGALQQRDVDYTADDGDVITFNVGLTAGDVVEVVCVNNLNGGVGDQASDIFFVQDGAGAVTRTVDSKLKDVVSVKDFGAVGDGVADDTAAVAAAITSQKPLDWGGLTYKVVSPITQIVTKPVIWYGNGASVIYNGSHAEYGIRLSDTAGVDFVINDITLDGNKLCNKVLEVLNNTSLTTPSDFTGNNLLVKRAKRLNTFNGGSGVAIRGAFSQVVLNGGGASDCELPAGQGTSGVAGISGIEVTWYSATSYVKKMVVNEIAVTKIYSSDLSYQDDQDGIKYFSPDDPSGTHKVPSEFTCDNSTFTNCYGRSIKTQCRNTIVRGSRFERTEGLTGGKGNGEIDAQTGSGLFQGCSFSYANGQQPDVCVTASSDSAYGRPGLTARDCDVYLTAGTTLSMFASVFPRNGSFSRHLIANCKVFGKVQTFFNFLCNGAKNYAEVSNCYIDEIVDGVTSEKALVYVRASGTTSPYSAFVTAFGNIYANTHLPAIVRDGIPGGSMNSALSAWSNVGFLNDLVNQVSGGLKTNQVNRIGRIGTSLIDYTLSGYLEVVTKSITSGATQTFAVKNNEGGCLLFIGARFNQTAYALISSSTSTNVSIAVGSAFAVGNTTNPGTGTFNVWSSGLNEISIQNTNASSRVVSVFVLSA